MEIQRIGTNKDYPRKSFQDYRLVEDDVVDNRKRDGSGQLSEIVHSITDGDIVALSFSGAVRSGERKAIGPIKSTLAKENNPDSPVSRGAVQKKTVSDLARVSSLSFNVAMKLDDDQRVAPEINGYAIKKYREALAYRSFTATTFEIYA